MEKLVCALWSGGIERDRFNAMLLGEMADALGHEGASRIRINIRDAIVEPGQALVQRWQAPQMDAVVQFWLPSANARFRKAIDAAIARHCGRFESWLVAESTILPNVDHPATAGERTWGWSQMSFINFRDDLDRMEAVKFWHSHHTQVAIDTQSNFEYVQNLIVRPLTETAPGYDALVEECFPISALTDPHSFFDAAGDPARFDANLAAMMESCGRFIRFGQIDVMPTSQYDIG